MIEMRGDARQIADAVAVAVGEAARVDLVDHRAAPPGGHAALHGLPAVEIIDRRHIRSLCASESTGRSEEHTSELQSLMRISYAVFCLKKKKTTPQTYHI